MISVEQIKAARGLLEWTQEDLSKASKISLPAVKQLEQRLSVPRLSTMQAIQTAFEDAGVEFMENMGLRFRTDQLNVQTFEGKDSPIRLWHDILNTLRTGEERIIAGVDETMFENIGGDRFRDMLAKFDKKGLKARILSCEGDTNFVDPTAEYRWVPKEYFSGVPYYVYGNKFAILLWEPVQRVIHIENKALADAYRKHFDAMWNHAIIPPYKFKVKPLG